jgi:CelD/BcsL family acetyltransferase involved in cellulose biosynthesis
VISTILQFLSNARSRWDLLVVGEVFAGGDLHRAVQSFAAARHFSIRVQEERPCPYVELPATFDEYLATFSHKRRHELRRQMRVLLEKNGAQIAVLTDPQDVGANLDTLVSLHASRWRRANQSGNMDRPGFVGFLRTICAAPPTGSSVRLYVMTQQGNALAAQLVFTSGPSALLYSMGWNSESTLANLSPGFVLTACTIRDSIERGARYFDFLRGDEAYKSHFTKSATHTVTLLIGQSMLAKAYLRALDIKDSLKHRFPRWWRGLDQIDRQSGAGPSREPSGASAGSATAG